MLDLLVIEIVMISVFPVYCTCNEVHSLDETHTSSCTLEVSCKRKSEYLVLVPRCIEWVIDHKVLCEFYVRCVSVVNVRDHSVITSGERRLKHRVHEYVGDELKRENHSNLI